MSTLGLPVGEIEAGANLSSVLSSEARILSTKVGGRAGLGLGGVVSVEGGGIPASGCRFSGEFTEDGGSIWTVFSDREG